MEHLPWVQVHLVRDLGGDLDEEAPMDVEDALGSAGRAARIADEQRVLALERLRAQRIVRLAGDELRPVVLIADSALARVTQDDGRADRVHAGEGTARRLHQGNGASLPHEGIGGQENLHAGVFQPNGDRVGPEAAEDRDPDGPDLRACHHRGDRLREHREEDPDGVARFDAEAAQRSSQPVCFATQVGVGPSPHHTVFALPGDGERLRRRRCPAVHALVREVHPAAAEPGRPLHSARDVEHLLVRRQEPDAQVADHRVPEPGDVGDGALHACLVCLDPVGAHETRDVGALDVLVGGRPDDVGHAAHDTRAARCTPRRPGARSPPPSIYMEPWGSEWLWPASAGPASPRRPPASLTRS